MKALVITSTFFFIRGEYDLCYFLYIQFLLILIHAHRVATVTKQLPQSWSLLWFYMWNLKVLLFMYGKELIVLATVHHGLKVRELDSNKGLQKCIHGFVYIVPLTFLNFTNKFNDTFKKDFLF